jgi:general secretion pathway protein G
MKSLAQLRIPSAPARLKAPGSRNAIVAISGGRFVLAMVLFGASQSGCWSSAPRESKEAALRQDLQVMRSVLAQYRADKGKGPDSLKGLVRDGYIRILPADPLTGSRTTWRVIRQPQAPGRTEPPAVLDVRSGATGISSDGPAYGSW